VSAQCGDDHCSVFVGDLSIWNDDESKELAASFGAAILLDKMDLAITLVPTIMDLKCEGGTVAASRVFPQRIRSSLKSNDYANVFTGQHTSTDWSGKGVYQGLTEIS
jgi:hypothetical protein